MSTSAAAPAAPSALSAPNLHAFLTQCRVDKGAEFTHTSLGRPMGSYYIPSSGAARFRELYGAAVARGDDLHLTERHRHVGPVVVDLDFRFDMTADDEQSAAETGFCQRRHTPELVRDVAAVYARALADLVEVPEGGGFDVYVMEKPHATTYRGLVKDGLHLVVPGVTTRPELQLLLRRDVLQPLAEVFRAHGLVLANRIEDVVDEAVIERNNWLMYGSKKPGGEAYVVTGRLRWQPGGGGGGGGSGSGTVIEVGCDALPPAAELPELFSIRNKHDELSAREAHRERVDAFIARHEEERKRREAVQQVMTSAGPNPRLNTCDDIELVRRLVAVLDARRVDNYNEWVRLGWCLRNIDHRLLEMWDEVSKRSPKYMEGECHRLWHSMRVGGLGMGTLHMWAREDSPDAYREILRTDLVSLIRTSINATHYDIARVVHHLYRYEYVCYNIRNRMWYEFREHRWRDCDSAYSLRRRLSTDVFREFVAVKQSLTQRAMLSDDEAEQKDMLQQSKKLADVALKLKVASFKDNVLKECAELFYQERFEDKLDSNPHLLCFENGVYDLERLEFREGRPEDYMSFSTGINYVDFVPDHPVVADVVRFWESVHPNRDIREYVLLTLASCLSGIIREERFHIWTGSGCHARGARVLLAGGGDAAVEDVRVGHRLLGDDSGERLVTRLFRGVADMYRIVPCDAPEDAFVVNGDHVLSLVVRKAAVARPRPDRPHAPFEVAWLERGPGGGMGPLWIKRTCAHADYDATMQHLLTLRKMRACSCSGLGSECECELLRDGDVLDVTVSAYMAHLTTLGARDPHLRLFRPARGVEFGDGSGGAAGFEEEVAEAAIAAAAEKKQALDAGADAAATGAPWPAAMHYGSRAVRCAVLCGLVGACPAFDRRSVVALLPTPARRAQALARSVGLSCRVTAYPAMAPRVALDFAGSTPAQLGALVDGTLGALPPSAAEGAATTTEFEVLQAPRAEYFGFELDGNHRYVMADSLIVTHNSNGKSLSVSLFEKTMGQYCCKFPVTLLTQKRAASNVATPEIARAKGRRFAVLQEPSEDERLNVGQLKELSGGDVVQTRELFKAPCEWRPQFKLFLLCNQLPHVPSDDGGTWRRIRVVEFGSKFVERPNPEHPNEFPMDLELTSKLEGWREHFMGLLITYYRRYATQTLCEPAPVVSCTREYQRTNDHMADFVDSCIRRVEPDDEQQQQQQQPAALSLDDAFTEFKDWVRADQIPIKVPKKTLFQRYLDRALVRGVTAPASQGSKGGGSDRGVVYRGFALRDRFSRLTTADDGGAF